MKTKKRFNPKIEVFSAFRTPFKDGDTYRVVSIETEKAAACCACTACTACR